jgi:hypothetical protein
MLKTKRACVITMGIVFFCFVVRADQTMPLTNKQCYYWAGQGAYVLNCAWANRAPSCGYTAGGQFPPSTYQDGCISQQCVQGHEYHPTYSVTYTTCCCDSITVTDDCTNIPGTTYAFCYTSVRIG